MGGAGEAGDWGCEVICELTDDTIGDLPSPVASAQEYYWDTKVKGFGLCVGRKHRTFVVRARVGEKMVKRTVGRVGSIGAARAREEASEILRSICGGSAPERIRKDPEGDIVSVRMIVRYENGVTRELRPETLGDVGIIGFRGDDGGGYLVFAIPAGASAFAGAVPLGEPSGGGVEVFF